MGEVLEAYRKPTHVPDDLFVPVLAVYAWVIGYGTRCSYWLRGAPTAPLDQ